METREGRAVRNVSYKGMTWQVRSGLFRHGAAKWSAVRLGEDWQVRFVVARIGTDW